MSATSLPDFQTAYESVDAEITVMHMEWIVFRQLFIDDEADAKLISCELPAFADAVFCGLSDRAMLAIARLSDNPSNRSQNNLSLRGLMNLIPTGIQPSVLRDLQSHLDTFLAQASSIVEYRHKRLAHSDIMQATGLAPPLQSVTVESVDRCMKSVSNFMNILNVAIKKSHAVYDSPFQLGNGCELVARVKASVTLNWLHTKATLGQITGDEALRILELPWVRLLQVSDAPVVNQE